MIIEERYMEKGPCTLPGKATARLLGRPGRLLVEGEVIQPTDEFDRGDGPWRPVARYMIGKAVDVMDEGYFRREIAEAQQGELFGGEAG